MFGHKSEETSDIENQDMAQASPTPRVTEPRIMAPAGAMQPRRAAPPARSSSMDRVGMNGEERKLIVGKGLSLAGEITACDVLVVEGKVEAKLPEGKLLEITETGQFRGSVEIENADIAGRYDGDLTVHGRLTIRGTGRITGIIKYGELEVNAGGQIIGEMQVVGAGNAATGKSPAFKSASKFSSLKEDKMEDEDEAALFNRKTVNG